MKASYPIWILISDSSHARLYSVETAHRPMVLREAYAHVENRAIEHGPVADKPLRMTQSHAAPRTDHGSHKAMEPQSSAKAIEQRRFAHTLADSLSSSSVSCGFS